MIKTKHLPAGRQGKSSWRKIIIFLGSTELFWNDFLAKMHHPLKYRSYSNEFHINRFSKWLWK